jgi:hypothetical protein
MLKQIANFLTKIGRQRIILDRESNEPYLERYYIFLKERKLFPFNIFLHKFLKSDPDDVHDHPWPYATLIIKGGYWEWIPHFDTVGRKTGEYQVWRGPGHFRVSKARSFHRIELDPDITAWTLFMPGPKQREWGFMVRNQWIQWEEYLKQRKSV